jgi:hypothetical protein
VDSGQWLARKSLFDEFAGLLAANH